MKLALCFGALFFLGTLSTLDAAKRKIGAKTIEDYNSYRKGVEEYLRSKGSEEKFERLDYDGDLEEIAEQLTGDCKDWDVGPDYRLYLVNDQEDSSIKSMMKNANGTESFDKTMELMKSPDKPKTMLYLEILNPKASAIGCVKKPCKTTIPDLKKMIGPTSSGNSSGNGSQETNGMVTLSFHSVCVIGKLAPTTGILVLLYSLLMIFITSF